MMFVVAWEIRISLDSVASCRCAVVGGKLMGRATIVGVNAQSCRRSEGVAAPERRYERGRNKSKWNYKRYFYEYGRKR